MMGLGRYMGYLLEAIHTICCRIMILNNNYYC
mgnify:CR=1 FL=1